MIRILREYERGVIFRLGKLLGTKRARIPAFSGGPLRHPASGAWPRLEVLEQGLAIFPAFQRLRSFHSTAPQLSLALDGDPTSELPRSAF